MNPLTDWMNGLPVEVAVKVVKPTLAVAEAKTLLGTTVVAVALVVVKEDAVAASVTKDEVVD